MKLFTTEEIRAIHRYTIENEGVSSLDLIERVGEGVADEIAVRWRPNKPTIIFAGPGNNGADALAAARMLYERGFRPEIYLFNIGGDKLSADCAAERDRLLGAAPEVNFAEVTNNFSMPEITVNHLVVDGLFGSGLREELKGGFKILVQYLNDEKATVVSIDVPSGLLGDWNPQIVNRNTVHATLTLAIQFPRISFFMADNAELVGEWKVLDIGLSEQAIAKTPTNYRLTDKRYIRYRLRPRLPFTSKADYGSAIIYGGSYGMMGAAQLAARGALRSGVGKLTVCAPKCGFQIMQTAVPEALFSYNQGDLHITEIYPDREYNAIAIGPGIGTNELTIKALENFLASADRPVILDADAINCMAIKPAMLNTLPLLSVLTPHVGEFDRLFGAQPSSEARLRKAIEMARYYSVIIVLKGHNTAIVDPHGNVFFNSSGTPAMATAGAGDVLTGVIAAFMAQGFPPIQAAFTSVYIHGVAGELAEEEQGEYGVTAGDIAANIGKAIRQTMK